MAATNERFEIYDKAGHVRIRLGLDDKGSPFLSLNDEKGCERIMLAIDDSGNGGISFREASGQPTLDIGVSRDLGLGMTAIDVKNETYLYFRVFNGDGEIRLETRDGTHVWPQED